MRPIMVEFTGTPEAGKTTVIKNLKKLLEVKNLEVAVVQESAELTPSEFPKGCWDSNVWMRYVTCANLLHTMYTPCDIILIDRGVIDLQFFGLKYFKANACSKEDFISYMTSFSPKLNPDFLITLVAQPETSLERRNGPGRLVNYEYLKEYNDLLYSFYKDLTLPKTLIETSNLSVEEVTLQVLEIVADLIKAR